MVTSEMQLHLVVWLPGGTHQHKIIEPEILAAQFVLVLIWLLAGESQGKFKVGCVRVGEGWGGVLSSAAGLGGANIAN